MVLGILVIAALALLVEVARIGGLLRGVDDRFAGSCSTVALAGSAEDIRVSRRTGLAYLSVLDRAALLRGESVNGSIMLLDLNLAEPAPRAALAYDPPGFRPHGISLLERDGEPARLFAISHLSDGTHTVEILEHEPTGPFVPRETVRAAEFVRPNALAAVGPREFYLANDTRDPRPGKQLADALLRRGDSTIVYYDGEKARVVASGLRFVAGIAASADGRHLYVAETLGGRLRIYRREGDGTLVPEDVVPLGTAPDNLAVAVDGTVWMAAHPRLFAFLGHMDDPRKRAPTQVLRFDPRAAADRARLTEIYSSRGEPLSAGSVAASWKDGFVTGAVLDHQVLICKTQK